MIQGTVRVSTLATCKRYGLTLEDWATIWRNQGSACGCCGTVPPSGWVYIEHEHVRGWKKMPPEERKKYVRGICCYTCNTVLLRRGVTEEKLVKAKDYLVRYHMRRLVHG